MRKPTLFLALGLLPTLAASLVLNTYREPVVPVAQASVPQPPEMRAPLLLVRGEKLYVMNVDARPLRACSLYLYVSRYTWTWRTEIRNLGVGRTVTSDSLTIRHWTGEDVTPEWSRLRRWTMRCVGIAAQGMFPRQQRWPVKIAMGER